MLNLPTCRSKLTIQYLQSLNIKVIALHNIKCDLTTSHIMGRANSVIIPTLSQIYPHWNSNSKLNTKLSLEFQIEYGFKFEFQVKLSIIWESALSFQYPHTLANSKTYWLQICCCWTKTCKLIIMLVSRLGIRGYLSTATPMLVALFSCAMVKQ